MSSLEKLGLWIADNPIIVVVAAVLLTFASLNYAQQITMQGMNTENFVGKESPLYQLYDHLFVERFGTQSIVVIIEGDDVTKPEVLKAMLRTSQQMETVPKATGTQSIANIVADAWSEETGVREIPSSQEEIDKILSSAQGVSSILPDKRHTMLAVEMPLSLSEDERSELLTETEDAVSTAVFPPDYGTTITGDPALQASIMAEMTNSNGPLMGLAAILMVFALLLVFRHVKWPLLPLPIVLLGIVWTFGAMGFLKIPMTMVSMSAFPILIGIGIDYAIQFHNRIDEEFSVGKTPAEAVMNTVNHVAGPVIIALFITAAGFLSLLTSSVPMIRDFGLVCLIGLFMCYLSALFVGVTTLYVVERKSNSGSRRAAKAATEDSGGSAIGSVLEKSAEFCIGRWQAVLAIALLLSLAGTYADFQVPVETDFKTYVPQDLPPLVEFRHMDNIFGGTDEINLVVQADDVTDPSTLEWMDEFSSYMATSRGQVVAATSIATYIKAANGGEIPQDKTQIRDIIDSIPASVKGQYLDGQDTALIDLNVGEAVSNLGVEGVDRLIKEVDKDLAWNPPPPGVSVRETGDLVVMTTVIGALTTGRSEMTLLGLVLIFFLLLVVYRDLIKALLPVLPMLVVIGWMGGVMYLGGLKYTPLTATLGALILGVGSEYAILMMERFYEELDKVGDPMKALKTSVNKIGSALIASGLTTVFGFAALMASPFMITNNFGLVTVMAVIFALLTTFTVFVVLMLRMEIRREAFASATSKIKDLKRRMTS